MKKIKNILKQNIILNLTYAVVILIYFVFFSIQYTKIPNLQLDFYINISSLFLLAIAIIIMEISFKKDDILAFLNGIEFVTIAIFILLTQHITRQFNYSIQVYTLSGADIFAVYYVLKSAILYTKDQQNRLNSLSDIKDIVKDEPIKKASKRKNKKIEEGK